MPAASHPAWCDRSERDPSYSHHRSASYVVPADQASDTVVELHLISTFSGLKPCAVLMMELSMADDDRPALYPLTLSQTGQPHEAVGRLLVASQPVTTGPAKAA